MNAEDKQYIAQIFEESYRDVVGDAMEYYVLEKSTPNVFNEITGEFLDPITVYGFYHRLQTQNPEVFPSTGKYDVAITFVATPLVGAGFTPKYGDVIEIINELGNAERYTVSGFQDRNEHSDMFARLFATKQVSK